MTKIDIINIKQKTSSSSVCIYEPSDPSGWSFHKHEATRSMSIPL